MKHLHKIVADPVVKKGWKWVANGKELKYKVNIQIIKEENSMDIDIFINEEWSYYLEGIDYEERLWNWPTFKVFLEVNKNKLDFIGGETLLDFNYIFATDPNYESCQYEYGK